MSGIGELALTETSIGNIKNSQESPSICSTAAPFVVVSCIDVLETFW